MDLTSMAVAGAAGTVAAASYLDARFNISEDLRRLAMVKKGQRIALSAAAEKRQSLWYLFEHTAQKYPTARMLWSREGCYTFAEGYTRSLQYANWLLSLGAKPKDCIALMSPNTPEFIFLSFAMWSIGCFPGMINYNLAGAGLVHCIRACGAKILLVEPEAALVTRVEGSKEQLNQMDISCVFLTGEIKKMVPASFPDTRPPNSTRDHAFGNFPFSLIFTSGTTGLPKPFPISTASLYGNSVQFKELTYMHVSENDRDIMYSSMPMYHSTGYVFGIESILIGMTCALGRRFSVSQFWKDIHDSGATCFSYVGETARYLLASPPSVLDRGHKLRLMFGNGLRPDVWERFQTRFNVPEVCEVFSSVEGMFIVVTYSRSGFGNKTVGQHGLIARYFMHDLYVPVRIDPDTMEMWRDPVTGFAERVPYEVGGEIIVKVPGKEAWAGYYHNPEGTAKKFITDVFQKGDTYYRPGDALRRDSDGFWYFLDRLGDTFRWKSENVSTAEVQHIMGQYPGIGEANVYGVQVPGNEGRAGCAAIVLNGSGPSSTFAWAGLAKFLRERLPRYAVPVFIRVVNADPQAMATHNNKQNKILLRDEGVNPANVGSKVPHGNADDLYWLVPGSDRYVPFGSDEWNSVEAGRAKL